MSKIRKNLNLIVLSLLAVSAVITAFDIVIGLAFTFTAAIIGFGMIMKENLKAEKVKSKNK